MNKKKRKDVVGHPSDFGSRTPADESTRQSAEIVEAEFFVTADGEPLVDRGSVCIELPREHDSTLTQP